MSGSILNKLPNDWNDVIDIVIYGYGKLAERTIWKLHKDFHIKCIVDNNKALYGKEFNGIKILNHTEAVEYLKKYKIIVCTAMNAYNKIEVGLKELGLKEFDNYCRLADFIAEWYWKNKNELCLIQAFSSITSRCTFKCKHCNMLMPYYNEDNSYEYSEDDIIADFEALFKRVDYLVSYFIIGGEPLLNKSLGKILKAVYERFNDKIGYIQIITNGSIMPDQELLDIINKCHVHVRMSDYTNVVSYKKKLDSVKETFQQNNVPYSMGIYDTWMDLGFPNVNPIYNDSDKIKCHMINCSQGCHLLNDKKFYFCGLMFSAEKAGLYTLRESDYIDLRNTSGDINEDKKELLNYCLGEVKDKYISICNICYGVGTDNHRIIPVGEQV